MLSYYFRLLFVCLFVFNHKLACYWADGLKILLFLISLFETITVSTRWTTKFENIYFRACGYF